MLIRLSNLHPSRLTAYRSYSTFSTRFLKDFMESNEEGPVALGIREKVTVKGLGEWLFIAFASARSSRH